MQQRYWDGKTVHFSHAPAPDKRDHELAMTDGTARQLALAIARLKQTSAGVGLEDSVNEVLAALNYVLVGDPESRAAHRRMEAGKGMEPSGG